VPEKAGSFSQDIYQLLNMRSHVICVIIYPRLSPLRKPFPAVRISLFGQFKLDSVRLVVIIINTKAKIEPHPKNGIC
jgi:hypothetical protein